MKIASVLVLTVGLGVTTVGQATPVTPEQSCIQATDFGAVPNDGLDDRERLQAAIDAAQAGPRCLEVGPGTFHATRRPGTGASTIGSLQITGALSLRGAGEGVAELAMLGSAAPGPRNWRLIEVVGASGVAISGLTLDGSERTDTGDHTHLLQVTGPAQDVLVEHVTFDQPIRSPGTGGDCVRLLGFPTAWVRNVTIRDVRGVECPRSFVSFQQSLDGIVVERSETVKVGGQSIDFEPTGSVDCRPIVQNIFMRQLTLRRATTSGPTVAISGHNCAVAENVTLTDSVVEDGTVLIIDAHDVTLSRVQVRSLPGSPLPAVHARDRIRNLRILDSVIERVGESGPGNAVRINGPSTACPTDVLLSGVKIRQATPEPLVESLNLARLVIVGSELEYAGAPVTNHAVEVAGTTATPAEAPVLVDSAIQGPLAGAVLMTGRFNGQPVLVRVTGPSQSEFMSDFRTR